MTLDPIVQAALVAAFPATLTVILQVQARRKQNTLQAKVEETQEKVSEAHHQITTNHHITDPPTLLDRIDALNFQVARLSRWASNHDDRHRMEQQANE